MARAHSALACMHQIRGKWSLIAAAQTVGHKELGGGGGQFTDIGSNGWGQTREPGRKLLYRTRWLRERASSTCSFAA